jgi:hypothetical protein
MSRSAVWILSLVLFATGLFLVFSSVNWGSNAANAYLRSHGGGMDGTQFAVVLQQSISMYRSIGGILSLLGGLGFVKAIELR